MNNNTPAASLPPQQPAARVSPVPGLAAGAALTVLGLLALFSPLATGVMLAYLITAGLR